MITALEPARQLVARKYPAGRTLGAAGVLVAVLAVSACAAPLSVDAPSSSADTTSLPDVTGESADEAQERLRELGFVVTLDAGQESVWQPANWMVDSQDPEAGEVAEGEMVTLHLVRPPAIPWNGITDGSWAGGDHAIGDAVRPPEAALTGNLRWDYEFTVSGAPTLTSADGGRTVTLTSPLTVTRIQAAWPEEQFDDAVTFIFRTESTPASETHDESWGTNTQVECDQETLTLGQSTTCTASFTAQPDALQDSYWWVNRTYSVAAWPGQQP